MLWLVPLIRVPGRWWQWLEPRRRARLVRGVGRQWARWYRWLTTPHLRPRFTRIGWQLVPRVFGAAQKFTDQSSTNATNRLSVAYSSDPIQLSDGTLVFIDHDGAGLSGHWFLKYSSDHSTINTIASNLEGTFTQLTTSANSFCAVRRDSLDNLYVIGSGPTSHVTVKAYTKGAGYTWTPQTALNSTTTSNKDYGVPIWCNTGGGTNSKGHLVVLVANSGQTAGTQVYVLDAGAALAGSGTLEISSTANPTFLGANQCSGLLDLDADGFGAASGVSVCGNAANASATCAVVNIGAWAINSSGAFTTNTAISSNVAIGSITVSTTPPAVSKARVIRYASNAFAIVAPSTTAGRYFLARYSASAQLTAFTDSGAPANLPLNAATRKWDAFLDPVTASKIWVIAHAALSGSTVQVYRLGCSVGSGVTWDGAVTTDESLTGLSTSTPPDLQNVKTPAGSIVDWQLYVQTSATVFALYGDYTQFASAPSAPTLTAPTNGAYQDISGGVTFTATYNSTDGGNQNAYALRQKVGAGAYSYWRASDNTWQSTIVWNTVSTAPGASFSVSPTGLSNGNVYNWSFASQEALGSLQGPFATDFVLNAQAVPALSVTAPTGTIVTGTQPTVAWTTTPAGGASQTNFRIVVEHGAYGTTPGSGTQDWDSTTLPGADQSRQVGVALSNAVTYRFFVQVTETGGELSLWAFSTATISLDPPAMPTLAAAYDLANSRVTLTVQGRDNMLSANQGSLETDTTGWAADTNCSISRVTAQALDGVASLQLSSTAAGNMKAITPTGTSGIPVQPNTQYTALASFRSAVSARTCVMTVLWYDAAGAFISNFSGTGVADTTGGWTQITATGTSPGNAAFAALDPQVSSTGGAAEIHYMDQISLAPGNSTVWTRGGLLGATTALLNYSDASSSGPWAAVRGAGAVPIPTGTQQATQYDYEAPPKGTRYYEAQVQANV